MTEVTLEQLNRAAQLVYQQMLPTPQLLWPQINALVGTEVWVKHENHTPAGAFKVRGGITFIDWLKSHHPDCKGIVTATRGNHGQSQARAASAAGLDAKIVVPFGNSQEKNNAMRSFGASVIEYGQDFDEAIPHARQLAESGNLFMVPAFHPSLMLGVATYAMELFAQAGELDAIYVPIGCGSGICGVISARDVLGYKTEVIGVVSEHAAGAKLSFEAGKIIGTDSADTLADGMAVRQPVPQAFDIYSRGANRVVAVSDTEIKQAMRALFACTHNVAEGAGAAALAALLQEKPQMSNQRVGVILSGGNVDSEVFASVLANN